jgi:hypothetical protein
MPDGRVALDEDTTFTFQATAGARIIDRVAVLRARDKPVTFSDNKEGAFGLRVARALQLPAKKDPPDAPGTGSYTSSEGKTDDDVWGTRGRWVMLTGTLEGAPVTIAMFDHPKNPGHPTHWHARGYGLFAANPFSQKALGKGEPFTLIVEKGKPVRFSYRVVILGKKATAAEVEAEYKRFLAESTAGRP